jgi:hypothetical protein
MEDLGIHGKLRDYDLPIFTQQFLFDKEESKQLLEILNTAPVKLDKKPGDHNIPKNLLPGHLPGGIMKGLDLGTLALIHREQFERWEVEYVINKKGNGINVSPGDLNIYPRFSFHLDDYVKGSLLSVTPEVSYFWMPKDCSEGMSTGNRTFADIAQEYLTQIGKSKYLVNAYGRSILHEGINFAPISAAPQIFDDLEHLTSNLTYSELGQLSGLNEMIGELGNRHVYSDAARDDAIKILRKSYNDKVREIASKIAESKSEKKSKEYVVH